MRILTTEDDPGAGPARHRGRRGRVVSVPALGITALLTTSAGLAWAIIQTPLPGAPTMADTGFPNLIRQYSDPPAQSSTRPPASSSGTSPATTPGPSPIATSAATPQPARNPPGSAPTTALPSRLPRSTSSAPAFSLVAAAQPATSGNAVITAFAYNGGTPSSTATVTVRVTAPSTAPLTLVLVYAGGDQPGVPGDNAPLEHDIRLSGQTSYVVTDTVDTLQFCYTAYFGVQASAGAPGQAPADYRSLRAPSCT